MKIKIILLHFIPLLFFFSCIEESNPVEIDYTIPIAAQMINYFEEQGNYINSIDNPSLLDATVVYNNLSSYKIIDLRDKSLYILGHINNAINVSPDSLLIYMETKIENRFENILLVSENGQVSSYYACLLILYGYNNVSSLNFGMASWNIVFADKWLANIKTTISIGLFDNNDYPKGNIGPLPDIKLEESLPNFEDVVKSRINSVITDEFLVEILPRALENNYIVCYGTRELYYANTFLDPIIVGHQSKTVHYYHEPNFDLRSTSLLQTLPRDKDIVIYSYAGQLSASIVAYLRVLGYNAKTLIYGACQLTYPRLISNNNMSPLVFDRSKISNYPFVTGQ